jgi:stage V sporulation protein B
LTGGEDRATRRRMSDQASAGRGLAFITLAKLYFIVMGFVVQVGLPRLLTPGEFGRYALAMSLVSVINNVLIASTVQSLSKRVSEAEGLAAARLRQGLVVQLGLGVVLAGGLIASAPLLAGIGYSAELAPLLRVVALVPLFYALYAALIGSLNGQQLFHRQAMLDATFSTLRTIGILGAAGLGFGALGSVAGFTAAAGAILLVALGVVGVGASGPRLGLGTWFEFMLPVVLFQLALNGMLLLDVWMLQNTTAQLGLASSDTALAAERATELVGFYKAGQNFAFVPYQIILSVTFIVFPLVSRATAAGDLDAARVHIAGALRFSILVLFGLGAPLGGGAEALMRLAYPKYLAGADALSILWFGLIALALFVIVATILSGAGKPWVTVWVGVLGLGLTLGANRLFVQAVGLGPNTLRAAAVATSLGTSCAFLASAVALKQMLGAGLPWLTLGRAAVAGAAGFGIARVLPQHSGLLAPVVLAFGVLAYAAVLIVTGELGRADLERVRAIVRKRRG